MENQKNSYECCGNGFSRIMAFTTGMLIGAGAVVFGTMVLKNKNNREKVRDVLVKAKEKTLDIADDLHKQAEEKKKEMSQKIEKGKEVLNKAVDTVIEVLKREDDTK